MNIRTPEPSLAAGGSPHSAGLIPPEDKRLTRSFELYLRAANKAQPSIESYVYGVQKAVTYLRGDLGLSAPLNEVTAEHLKEVMNWLLQAYKPATAYSVYASLKKFYGWLVDEGELPADKNPMTRVPSPTVPEQETPILSKPSIKALLQACSRDRQRGHRDSAIVLLMLDCGLRVSEMCNLNIDDADLVDRLLSIKLGKGRRPRTVIFSARTAQAIDRYLSGHRKGAQEQDALFVGRYGARITPEAVRDMLTRRGREAGLRERIHPHRLRHTSATAMADAGMQEGELRSIFGWSPGSQQVYRYTKSTAAKRAREAQRRANVLDRLLD